MFPLLPLRLLSKSNHGELQVHFVQRKASARDEVDVNVCWAFRRLPLLEKRRLKKDLCSLVKRLDHGGGISGKKYIARTEIRPEVCANFEETWAWRRGSR